MPAEKRCLIVSPDYPPARGGIQTLVHRLAQDFTRLHPRVVTSTPCPGREPPGPEVIRHGGALQGGRSAIALLNVATTREAIRFRPDVILSGHIAATPGAALAGRMLRAPVVQYAHGRELTHRAWLTRLALRSAQHTIAVSEHTRTVAIAHGADGDRLSVIPPGVDITPASPARRDGPPTMLTVARLTESYKGHDVLFRALPLIRARVPTARWAVVGDGPLRPGLERAVADAGLDHCVEFLGEIDDHERDRWFDRSHVFAMPSRVPASGAGEGFGIVYLEAGLHGLPVVAGAEGGALDAVVDGETGLLVDPRDHVALANAIADLLNDRERATRLGRTGAERARRHAWPVIAHRVEDLLLAHSDGMVR